MSEQSLLFDLHPEGTEPPASQRPITPGCLLPLPVKQQVDMRRACAILDVTPFMTITLRKRGLIRGYRADGSSNKYTFLLFDYESIVAFCDKLRRQFLIPDRRPHLAPGRRWRDVDLLPFPKHETCPIEDLMTGLDVSYYHAVKRIEEGAVEAYRLYNGSPWRIHKPSLFRLADRMKQDLESGQSVPKPPRRRRSC